MSCRVLAVEVVGQFKAAGRSEAACMQSALVLFRPEAAYTCTFFLLAAVMFSLFLCPRRTYTSVYNPDDPCCDQSASRVLWWCRGVCWGWQCVLTVSLHCTYKYITTSLMQSMKILLKPYLEVF